MERTRQSFTKRTQGFLPVREITKRTQEGVWGTTRKYETNPRPRSSQRLDGRLDICTIFIRAVATGGKRGSDVMGNIGEIPPPEGRDPPLGHLTASSFPRRLAPAGWVVFRTGQALTAF